MVRWLDEQGAAFAVARLIMMTGVKVRSFDETTPDDPAVIKKLEGALRVVLGAEQQQQAIKILNGRLHATAGEGAGA